MEIGEHTDELLAFLGYDSETIARNNCQLTELHQAHTLEVFIGRFYTL